MAEVWGGIEAGGTKFVCLVGSGPDDIRAEERFPTTTPEETLGQAIDFFHAAQEELKGIGIASFGPVDLNPSSPTYGFITTTPKPGWAHADITGPIRAALELPVAFDTDVNGAALGEHTWGAGRGLENFVYVTVGTGIGGGAMVDGRLVHGLLHPEIGHLRIPHDLEADPFPGVCPFHQDCLEGLANGPAIEARWGMPGGELSADHAAWELEAHYLALACMNLSLTYSPQRIILGGGVMRQPVLFRLIRQKTLSLLNGYLQHPAILEEIDGYIVPPGLGERSGALGALALAGAV